MQSYNTLVSIVMPAYNAEKTIQESINSVITQTYKEWELLVVDDGSTDNTRGLVESYKCLNIKLLRNLYGKGAAGARKTAIEHANGRYIAFLDSDDIWQITKLKTQLEFMNTNAVSFVYSDYSTFQDKISNVKSVVLVPTKLSYNDLIKNCMIGCLTVMLDKTAFKEFDF
ncbi:glycosyltransferase family 2 protein, partial [Aliivibrio sp. SR45-2]|uniref:glycosyltransferase family 2 protein n=1 Tax=Aliivibrio sp. SR45-2 TaxID=2760931 RepID=UPI0015FAD793